LLAERLESSEVLTLTVENDFTLDAPNNELEQLDEQYWTILPAPACTSEDKSSSEESAACPIPIEYKKKAVEFWRNRGGKQRSFESVKHRFRKVKHRSDLNNWEQQVENGGTTAEKLKFIAKETYRKFVESRERHKNVHDNNIRKWALRYARLADLDNFKASTFWLRCFKKKFNIVSRKITKFITRKSAQSELDVLSSASTFVGEISELIKTHSVQCVFNTDQSGFNQEFHGGRTLNQQGDKIILAEAQSMNALTHSYTVQPIVSADGVLLPQLLVVLKENDGNFGPIVKNSLFTAPNSYSVPSKSGKLTKALVHEWLNNVYCKNVPNISVLLLDSWTAQNEKSIVESTPADKVIIVKTIPKGTTGYVQPLDVYGFRIWKQFVRYFYDLIVLNDFDINIHLRNNLLKMQSITHNQLSSPRFQNMWRYSWYKCGYIDVKPPTFVNPVEFCYKQDCMSCFCDICEGDTVAKCAWCKQSLCIDHFFVNIHYCDNYIE